MGADIIHLYFSNEKEEKEDDNIPSNTPSMIKQWSMQTTPRQSVAPIFTFNDDDNDDCNDSDKENSATISFSPSSSMRTPLVSSPDTEIYRNSDSSEMVKYGYKIIKLIDDTLHGCIYEAEKITKEREKIVIKKVDKETYKVTVNMDDENIVKEAIILHYFTELNQSPSGCICSFVDFIESKQSYFLIMEHCGMTLTEFVKTAHQYISEKKLKLKDWRTVTKFIIWQLSVCLFWLHNDMKVCHLDLNMDNIMI